MNEPTTKTTGGCLCGSIRYEVEGEPFRALNCHCNDCRRSTGSAFTTIVFYKDEQLKLVSGELKAFDHKADSGRKVRKLFCGDCGTQLFGTTEHRSGVTYIRIGTFDDANFVRPDLNLYMARALKSTLIDEDLASFEEMPPPG